MAMIICLPAVNWYKNAKLALIVDAMSKLYAMYNYRATKNSYLLKYNELSASGQKGIVSFIK
jgi:hypothetical protein